MKDFGTWAGIILGIAGLIAAYVFYRRSLIKQKIAFVISSIQITGRNSRFPSELKIFYGNKEVENVTQSNIIIWNAGNSTIDGERIVSDDPLRLVTSQGSEILAAAIISTTSEVNAFSGKVRDKHPNEQILTFDFLDPNDGAFINLTHTGNRKVDVEGTIRGIPKGVTPLGDIPPPPDKRFFFQMAATTSAPVVAIIGGIYYLQNLRLIILLSLVCSMFFILGAFGLFVTWRIRQRRPPEMLLKKLTFSTSDE